MIPGEYRLAGEPIVCNQGRATIEIDVTNTGDRPIQVGSHYHFAETNAALQPAPRNHCRHRNQQLVLFAR